MNRSAMSVARKVSGALGIKVDGDIVLESSSQISLKAGGSFIVIHAGGVDITGLRINLNGGGSTGTPVGVMQPGVLEGLADKDGDSLANEGKGGSGDSVGESGSVQTTSETELNHMFGSIKGIDGIQSKELVFRPFAEEK